MSKFDTFIKAYQSSSSELRDFIDSGKVGEFCEKILTDTGFEKLRGKLNIIIATEIVNQNKNSDLIVELKSIGLSDDFIINKSKEIKKFIADSQSQNLSNVLDSEIAEAEASLQIITNTPTQTEHPSAPKAYEVTPEPSYSSTQSAILEEGKRPISTKEEIVSIETPETKPTDSPRWETS